MLKKILTMILVPLVVTAITVIGAFVVFEKRSTNRSFTEQRETVLRFAVDNVELGLETGRLNSVRKTLGQLDTYSIFAGAVLFDAEMTPILTMPKEFEVPTSVLANEMAPRSWKFSQQGRSYESGILKDEAGEVIGDLLIVFTNKPIRTANQRALVLSFTFGMFILLPLVALVAWAVVRMLKPIQRLVETMQLVSAERDYSLRVKVESNDEVGMLCAGFNLMFGRLPGTKIRLRKRSN